MWGRWDLEWDLVTLVIWSQTTLVILSAGYRYKYWSCYTTDRLVGLGQMYNIGFLGTIALQINIISRDYIHSMNLFISFGMNLCCRIFARSLHKQMLDR